MQMVDLTNIYLSFAIGWYVSASNFDGLQIIKLSQIIHFWNYLHFSVNRPICVCVQCVCECVSDSFKINATLDNGNQYEA